MNYIVLLIENRSPRVNPIDLRHESMLTPRRLLSSSHRPYFGCAKLKPFQSQSFTFCHALERPSYTTFQEGVAQLRRALDLG